MRLSVVAPVFKTASYLEELHARLTKAVSIARGSCEFIFVIDGSPDDALEVLLRLRKKDPRVKIVDLSRNFGHHHTIMVGLSHATGERVFLIDSDLEEAPEWLGEFDAILRRKSCDVVYGVQDRRKGGWFERLSGWAFYGIFNLLSDVKVPRNFTTARLMTRRYVDALLRFDEREVFLGGLFMAAGFAQESCVVVKRSRGITTYNLARKIALSINALTSFSEKILVYIFYTGLGITGLALLYVVFILAFRLFGGVPIGGWPSLIVSVWFLGGLTILFLGMIGIYLSKIFQETKQRPYAIIRGSWGLGPQRRGPR